MKDVTKHRDTEGSARVQIDKVRVAQHRSRPDGRLTPLLTLWADDLPDLNLSYLNRQKQRVESKMHLCMHAGSFHSKEMFCVHVDAFSCYKLKTKNKNKKAVFETNCLQTSFICIKTMFLHLKCKQFVGGFGINTQILSN